MMLTGMASAVSKGTAFERRSMALLQNYFSMSLDRVGGASDGGIDLQGWWWLPPASANNANSALSSKRTAVITPTQESARRRLRVLAQCKAYAKKLGPSVVREMEGVVYQHWITSKEVLRANSRTSPLNTSQEDIVALIISLSPFTKQSVLRAMSSSVPFLLMHLPEPPIAHELTPLDSTELTQEPISGSVLWNAALASRDGLLRGEYEVRWVHKSEDKNYGAGGRPGIWWNGRPLSDWVPVGSPATIIGL